MPRERSAGGATRGRFTRGRTGSGGTGSSTVGTSSTAGRIVRAVTPFIGARDGICNCATPITDEDAGVLTADDDDDGWLFCWRCGKSIVPPD